MDILAANSLGATSAFFILCKNIAMHGVIPVHSFVGPHSEAAVYAIVEVGGKQYRVEEGDVLTIDRLAGEEGAQIEFGRVLLLGGDDKTTIGTPVVDGALVSAKILEHKRDKKKIVFKYNSKKRYRVKKGHRQHISRVQIQTIQF